MTHPVRLLFGCEPDKSSTNILNINGGCIGEYYGDDVYDLPNETRIDLTHTGCWGLDVAGSLLPPQGKTSVDLYVYAIKNPATGDKALIATKQKYAGDVTYPSGYTFFRKLPWGVMYSALWDGIPNFHLTHWPMPEIRFTDSEYGSPWMPLFGGTSTAWTDIDLSGYVPDNARLAHVMAEVRYNSGSAGSGYLRTYSGQSTGLLIGSASPGSPFPGQSYVPIRITSDRKIQFKTTGSVAMYLQVLGYSMTEPA